jgi:hypothetical protein
MGPPTEIIHKLREIYGITKFIETGTFLGDTAYWASNLFEYVSTIEGGKDIYKQVTEKYGHVRNIEFMYGNSTERLS